MYIQIYLKIAADPAPPASRVSAVRILHKSLYFRFLYYIQPTFLQPTLPEFYVPASSPTNSLTGMRGKRKSHTFRVSSPAPPLVITVWVSRDTATSLGAPLAPPVWLSVSACVSVSVPVSTPQVCACIETSGEREEEEDCACPHILSVPSEDNTR